MRYKVSFVAASIFFFIPLFAQVPEANSPATSSRIDKLISTNPAHVCDTSVNAPAKSNLVAESVTKRDSAASSLPATSFADTSPADTIPAVADLDHDLKNLAARQTALADCISAISGSMPLQSLEGACSGQLLLNFEMRHDGEPERDIPIGRLSGNSAFFFESGMTIDADGAPNAYHPDNLGIDDLANAGSPGSWEGLAKNADGEPFIQGPDDPFPGYYVSATALADHSKAVNDPTRYVDASKIPFVVLPGGMARGIGARPGDFAVVFNQRNGKSSYAIFGDVGPHDRIGEGSVALAENLGVRSDARNGGARRGILYLIFPGSGNGRPRTIDEINTEGQRLLLDWERADSRDACVIEVPERAREGNPGAN